MTYSEEQNLLQRNILGHDKYITIQDSLLCNALVQQMITSTSENTIFI